MIELRGIGLHSGEQTTVRIHPADGPVRFRVGPTEFRPLASRVVDTSRCTVLGDGDIRLMTVEHLLAALHIQRIWQGVVIEVSGLEIPILDGSAREWLEALKDIPAAGPQPAPLESSLRVEENRSSEGASRTPHTRHSSALAQPAETFSVLVTIAFPHPKIGYQQVECPPLALAELASARTFGFLGEVEELRARGLIRGASMENALVFSQTDAVNTPRMLHEPVWHKALDFLGDLYLAGVPYLGRFIVHRGSHRLQVALAKLLQPPGLH